MAQNPYNALAQQLVNQLQAGGMSYAEIGRRVGRDSSLISQIGRHGNKGASLVSALQQIQGGAKSVNVARRQTKAGKAAGVRQGVRTVTTRSGKQQSVARYGKGGAKSLKKEIGKAAGTGQGLKWDVHFGKLKTYPDKPPAPGWVTGHLPDGWTAQTLLDRINNPQSGDNWKAGDTNGALRAIALEQNPKVLKATGADEYSLFTIG